jgi:hypothetical protein
MGNRVLSFDALQSEVFESMREIMPDVAILKWMVVVNIVLNMAICAKLFLG